MSKIDMLEEVDISSFTSQDNIHKCGNDLESSQDQLNPTGKREKGKRKPPPFLSKKIIIIGSILFFIVILSLIAVATVLLVQASEESDSTASPTASESSSSSSSISPPVSQPPNASDPFKVTATINFNLSDDPYEVLSDDPFNNDVEDDRSVHPVGFEPHLIIIQDDVLNKPVLQITMHRDIDKDGNLGNPYLDRQRTEFKASSQSDKSVVGLENETISFDWKFHVDADISASSNFFHIFQIKPVGGESTAPMMTFSIRKESSISYLASSLSGKYYTIMKPISEVGGQWIHAYVEMYQHSIEGYHYIQLKDLNGDLLYEKNYTGLDHWPEGVSLYRPKFGIYRSLKSKSQLNEIDQIRFADITIAKKTIQ